MNSPPPSEPSQAATGAPPPPHPHAPNYSSMPHSAHPSSQPQPHFAPSTAHGSSHPHYPAQYYHGSYFDSFARPRRWWWGGWSSSLHQVPPPVMPPPPGAAPPLPPHPSLPYEPYHQQRMYRTCYHRRGRGPRLFFPVLAFGAIVFFATKHHYARREQDRERFMRSVVQDGSSTPTLSSPSHWDRRAPGPWHWHDRERERECRRVRASEPAKTTTGATAVGEEVGQQQTHDEMWAEQWAKAMGRVPPAEKQQQRGSGADGDKWV